MELRARLVRTGDTEKAHDNTYFVECGKCKEIRALPYKSYRSIFPKNLNSKRANSGLCKICKSKPNSGNFKKGMVPANKGKFTAVCLHCGKHTKKQGKLCMGCYRISQKKLRLGVCVVCKNHYDKPDKESKFCSRDCFRESRVWVKIGKDHHNWTGSTSRSERSKVMDTQEYKKWRQAVFRRDNWTCVFCKARGVTLNADHIKRYAFYPKLRFELSNGRTLCVPCHKKTDTWGRPAKRVNHLELHR